LKRQKIPDEQWLLNTVARHSAKAGIKAPEEGGIYDSPQPNAFYGEFVTKNEVLLAVSTGLILGVRQNEVDVNDTKLRTLPMVTW